MAGLLLRRPDLSLPLLLLLPLLQPCLGRLWLLLSPPSAAGLRGRACSRPRRPATPTTSTPSWRRCSLHRRTWLKALILQILQLERVLQAVLVLRLRLMHCPA